MNPETPWKARFIRAFVICRQNLARFFVSSNYNFTTMKNILLTGILGAAISISCSTAKTAQANRAEFLQLKGDWQITSIDYDKNYNVRPFDEGADAQCFVGSHWRLIPNNWSGSYTLDGGGACPSVIQPIKFEVVEKPNDWTRKPTESLYLIRQIFKIRISGLNSSIGRWTLPWRWKIPSRNTYK